MKQNYYRMVKGVVTPLTMEQAKTIIKAYSMIGVGFIKTLTYEENDEEHVILLLPAEYKVMKATI